MLRNLLSACAEHRTPIESVLSAALESIDDPYQLLVAVPKAVRLHLARTDQPEAVGTAFVMRTPNVLVLEREHCQDLRLHGTSQIQEARLGYINHSDTDVRIAFPNASEDVVLGEPGYAEAKNVVRTWNRWRVDPAGAPLCVRQADVLVDSGVFERVIRYLKRVGTPHRWVSEELQLAWAAAEKFWSPGTVIEEERESWPSKEVILDWLKGSGLKPHQAERVELLISPSFVERRGPKPR